MRITRREFLRRSAIGGAALSFGVLGVRSASSGVDPDGLRKLAKGLKGRLIVPGDHEYETARRVWNFRFDRHPAAIVRCASADDVARALEFGRTRAVPIAVRSGGHSFAGFSTCDDGIVIDLSQMTKVAIDPKRRIAHVQPGITGGGLDQVLQRQGFVVPVGQCHAVGVGGLALGGGEGILAGTLGATCDQILAADVVTADGRIVRASPDEYADLLWGICGGGGNLGIVTSFEFRVHPLRECTFASLVYAPEQTRDAFRYLTDFVRTASDEVYAQIIMVRANAEPTALLFACHSGDLKDGERALAPLRSLGKPRSITIKRASYLETQRLAAGPHVWGRPCYQRAGILPDLPEEYAARIAADFPPNDASWAGFFLLHGAISKRPPDANAYPIRAAGYDIWLHGEWEHASPGTEAVVWVDRMWEATRGFAKDVVYVNSLDDEPEERKRAAYGGNYARLAQLKREYDPDNVLRLNVNVPPATT
ncbi:MAG: FAD-binding oxidoreductase [Deltaproteobacteria bacterium]|nr:FAD-binding oxidoreductase [Deltaproteobacteria bacterium]